LWPPLSHQTESAASFSALSAPCSTSPRHGPSSRAKTWWYVVLRWYFWVGPDAKTLDRLNVTGLRLDHAIVPMQSSSLDAVTYRVWLGSIEARARLRGSLAAVHLELEA
jgi:hypothetical protein